MLATLTGDLCLLAGLALLLLPLLATELSRPRDSAWGALVLLLGLVLVTSSDRLRGAPMLAVVCATLLITRLGVEVGQGRWNQLGEEERQRLRSSERWSTSLQQLLAAIRRLAGNTGSALASLKPPSAAPDRPEGSNRSGKRWVRPEPSTQATNPEATNTETTKPADTGVADTGAAESSGQDG
ncbi:putative N-terminaldomain of isoleucyl-tRNA synthetase [Synechococcus sp. RS9909]|uniref:Ycf66 family protein n=1 Tax=unclassified Synechococcus TaxID=2626047 RepID=UPI0000690915|nr:MULTISPECIES: Ycf66 family protein [unclassified Synechococcus]EAQ68649.1 hypothetical protein RS9917_03668 [Synechococcus sp. RS9917]QNI78441.1 putative N-terminaldomain of isoleucyl-tRNA synthetase [Synechococcus sp. RS9909]